MIGAPRRAASAAVEIDHAQRVGRRAETEPIARVERIRPEGQARADLAEGRRGFIDHHTPVDLAQCQRGA